MSKRKRKRPQKVETPEVRLIKDFCRQAEQRLIANGELPTVLISARENETHEVVSWLTMVSPEHWDTLAKSLRWVADQMEKRVVRFTVPDPTTN